jgi:hypothetical protein
MSLLGVESSGALGVAGQDCDFNVTLVCTLHAFACAYYVCACYARISSHEPPMIDASLASTYVLGPGLANFGPPFSSSSIPVFAQPLLVPAQNI